MATSQSYHSIRPTYRYQNLVAPDWLRILMIQPADPDSILICELQAHENAKAIKYNAEDGTRATGYETLSWCWGNEGADDKDLVIIENGVSSTLKVRPALHAALLALRRRGTPRYLWVDQVCINQQDLAERNNQVARMNEIFGDAANVCIWLDSADDSSRLAMTFIKSKLDKAYLFDKHQNKRHLHEWVALIALIKKPWFARRWIVQEVALARSATVHCGSDFVSWGQLCSAISLMIETEGVLTKLSDHARQDEKLGYPDGFFAEVPNLAAARLVDITHRFFKRHADNVLKPTNTLEDVMAWLPRFESTEPRDIVYALLALAKDTQAAVVDQMPDLLYGKRLNERQKRSLRNIVKWLPTFHRQSYPVDYSLDVDDVYQQFVRFVISRAERKRALDIICRPFAQNYYVDYKSEPVRQPIDLPSWIPSVDKLPFVKNDVVSYLNPNAGTSHHSVDRERGDLFVSTPESHSFYTAAGQRDCDISRVRFRKRKGNPSKFEDHFSMFVEGFVLDTISTAEDKSQDGFIPRGWLELYHKHKSSVRPSAFWRTLVADRGPKGTTPAFYEHTLIEVLEEPRNGSLNTQRLIRDKKSLQVTDVMRHIVATVSDRRLIETTKHAFLGLVPGDAREGDLVCILFGCSVPVILRRAQLKDIEAEQEYDDATYLRKKDEIFKKLREWRTRRYDLRQSVPAPTSFSFSSADIFLTARLILLFTTATVISRLYDALPGLLFTMITTFVIFCHSTTVQKRDRKIAVLMFSIYLAHTYTTDGPIRMASSAAILALVVFLSAPEMLPRAFWIGVTPRLLRRWYNIITRQKKDVKLSKALEEVELDLGNSPDDPRYIAHHYAFTLIGESYIDTMMTGEAIRLQNESVQTSDRIHTVTFELR